MKYDFDALGSDATLQGVGNGTGEFKMLKKKIMEPPNFLEFKSKTLAPKMFILHIEMNGLECP